MTLTEEINIEGVFSKLYGENKADELTSEQIKEGLLTLKQSRATHKRKITMYLNYLKQMHGNGTLTSSLCQKQIKVIDEESLRVNNWNEVINIFMQNTNYNIKDEESYNLELDSQAEYNINNLIIIDTYEDHLTSENTKASAVILINEILSDGKLPPLTCGTFDGKEKDKFAFHNFLNQFNNVIDSKKHLSESVKLLYLIGYLRDYALKQVNHSSLTDSNYKVALNLLKEEFLDKEFIIDKTLKNILKAMPSKEYDPEFLNIKYHLSEIKSYLYELQQYVNFFQEGSSGNILISHMIMNKLPKIVVKELINKINNNYPSLEQIFNSYNKVLKTLIRTVSGRKNIKDKKISSGNDNKHRFEIKSKK